MKLILEGVKRYAEYDITKGEISCLTKQINDDTRLEDHIVYSITENEEKVATGIIDIFYGTRKELLDGIEYVLALTKEQSYLIRLNVKKMRNLFIFIYQTEGRNILDYMTTDTLLALINNTYDYNANKCIIKCKRYGK